MTKIKRIEKELEKLGKERDKIVAEATKENAKRFHELQKELKLAKNESAKKIIGKCYKTTDREMGVIGAGCFPRCWDRYFKIVGIKKEYDRLVVVEFTKAPDGNIIINKHGYSHDYMSDLLKLGNATEIKQSEFDEEFDKLVGELKWVV